MAHIEKVLQTIRTDDPNKVKEGKRFENLLKNALENHPGIYGKERFQKIWLWKDWPDLRKHGYTAQDIGIDLVARETEAMGGGLVAIQAKFGESQISTQQVDSFLSASGTDFFRPAFWFQAVTLPRLVIKK